MLQRLVFIGTLAICAFPTAAVQAETHALVVGVDRYRNISALRGAVADANDIGRALKKRGVRNLTLLLNGEASRDRVLETLDQIVQQAKHGDLVIITFAGHGSRERWGQARPPGISAGDQREVFLLADVILPNVGGQIDISLGGSARERIAGAEMNVRLRALQAKGARTVFVADTCYGGGLTKNIRPPLVETSPASYRYAQSLSIRDGVDPLVPVFRALPEPVDTDKALPDLTFLAAVDATQPSPEVEIPKGSGSWRGALSYAFARVIEGSVMIGQGGAITRADLVDYINPTIRAQSENRQEPDLRPRQDFTRTVIDTVRDFGDTPAVRPSTGASTSNKVRVFSVDAIPVASGFHSGGAVEIEVASSVSDADVILRGSNAFSRGGDLVASQISGNEMRGLAEREVAFRRLLALSLDRPRQIRLQGGDKRYVLGERVVVDARRLEGPRDEAEYYLLFNIAGSGQVQFLYPRRKANGFREDQEDPILLPSDRPLTQIEATPPAGTDLLVLVTSPKPLDGLTAELTKLHNRVEPLRAIDLVGKSLDDGVRIGTQGIFTGSSELNGGGPRQ